MIADIIKSSLVKTVRVFKRMPPWLAHFVLPVGIIGVGVLIAYSLYTSRRSPQRIVEVQQIDLRDIQMVVRGFGTVSPKVQVEIVPQVSGNVVYVNPQLKPGGFIHAGRKILRVDPRDYELAVQQAEALVADALVKLDLEKAEAQVARKEWDQINPNTEPTSPLVLREPYIRQAQAMLDSAQAQLAKAKLNLERTQLSLPVDAVIMSEKVDLGQFISVGQSIGVAYGVDLVEVEVPLEDEELAWFDIPDNPTSLNGGKPSTGGAIAQVRTDFAGAEHTWKGFVKRSTGQVDRASRLVSIVVEVPEPFKNSDSKPPLLPGLFVDVLIEGKVLKNAVAVPRDAVRNADEVWVVENGRLHIKHLDIIRSDKEFAYALSGLNDGAQIVVSALDAVTSGMSVRTQSTAETMSDHPNIDNNLPESRGTD
ncbi:MAG: efflux RND transporter periplasmic adaptor subunit [Planctomycetota bacterium]|jgi:RND family efflux transporter MFP subunit